MSWLCAENRMNTALIVFRALHGFPAAEGAAFYGKTFEKAPPAVGGFDAAASGGSGRAFRPVGEYHLAGYTV